MGEVIALVSGKGGTGKTTAAVNLGCGLAKAGARTVIVDLDFGLRSCDLLLGMEDRILYDCGDVLAGRCSPEEALLADARYPGLYLLPAPQRADRAELAPGQVRKLAEALKERFDAVLLDAPAGLGEGLLAATEECSLILLVLTQERASVRAADQVIRILGGACREKTALLLNRYREQEAARGIFADSEEIGSLLPCPLFGTVPEDEQVVRLGEAGIPVTGRACGAGQAFAKLSRQLLFG